MLPDILAILILLLIDLSIYPSTTVADFHPPCHGVVDSNIKQFFNVFLTKCLFQRIVSYSFHFYKTQEIFCGWYLLVLKACIFSIIRQE